MLSCSAVQLSSDSRDSLFSDDGSPTLNNDQRTRLKRDRQEIQLQVDLGDAGTFSVGPRRQGDVAEDWRSALHVDLDGTDAECFLELRTCSYCWISLTAILNRFEKSKDTTLEDDRYLLTVNNHNDSDAVSCQLWLVVFVTVYAAYITHHHHHQSHASDS